MNPRYILPLCFAAAVHGALLFGFTKPARFSPVVPREKTVLTPLEIHAFEKVIPTPLENERSEGAPRTARDEPRPYRSSDPGVRLEFGALSTMHRPPIALERWRDAHGIALPILGGPNRDGDASWKLNDILPTGRLDDSPRTRFQPAPLYPFEAKRAGVSGEVHVDFIVDERGHVVDAQVVQSSNRIFDEPTLRAVAKWQFEPGRHHGKVVRFRMRVPVMFSLNEGL